MSPKHLFLFTAALLCASCELLAEPPATTTTISFGGDGGSNEVFDKLGEAKAYLVTNAEGGAYVTEFRIRWEDFGEDGTDLDLSITHDAPTLPDGSHEVFGITSENSGEASESKKLWGQLFINDGGTFHEVATESGTFAVTSVEGGMDVAFDVTLRHEIVESMVVDELGKVEETRTQQAPVTLKMTLNFPDATSFQGRL